MKPGIIGISFQKSQPPEVLAQSRFVILSVAKDLDSSVASLPQNDKLGEIHKTLKYLFLKA